MRERGTQEPGGPLTQAAILLEQVVARDPDYAPAWGLLALAQAHTARPARALDLGMVADFKRKAENASQQAIRLDPNNTDAYTALGLMRRYEGRFAEAEDLFKNAFSLDPGNPEGLHLYSLSLAMVGRVKEAVPLRERLRAQEPLVPQFNEDTALILWASGRNDEAMAIYKARQNAYGQARTYASMGRYNDAAEALQMLPWRKLRPEQVEEAVRLMRAAPAPVQAGLPPSPPINGRYRHLSQGPLGFVYLYVGAPDRALDYYELAAKADALDATPPLGSHICACAQDGAVQDAHAQCRLC